MDTTTIPSVTIIGYNIIDRQTKQKVGFAKTRAGATRSVDKRDNEYGGYRFYSQPVYQD